jgi:hypothetical protein
MRLYPSLFAYLNESLPVPQDTLLQARDRPFTNAAECQYSHP